MIGLGLGLVRQAVRNASGQSWTPALLFSNGEQGVWYEPKPQYLFQDAAGTVPVTADGDPVGRMQDLSGNGHHATQSTSADRPIYRTDGALHWLEFDGVDDHLSLSANISRGEDGFVSLLWGSAVPLSLDDNLVFSNGAGGVNGEHIGYNDGEYLRVFPDESSAGKSFGSRISADVNHIISIKAGTSYSYGVNGDIYFNGTGERAYSQTINTIGINSGARQIKGVYFGIVVVSKNIDEDIREKTEQYLANLAGVTL